MEMDRRGPVVWLAGPHDGRWDESARDADGEIPRGHRRGGWEAPLAGPVHGRKGQPEHADSRWANADLRGAGAQDRETGEWFRRQRGLEERIPPPVQYAGAERR